MPSKQALRAKEGRREGRKARSVPGWYERAALRTSAPSREDWRARCWGSRATGASAALPPLAPPGAGAMSPLCRRSAGEASRKKLNDGLPRGETQARARLSAAHSPRKRIASSRSLVHTSVWYRGQHKRTKSRRRRARSPNRPLPTLTPHERQPARETSGRGARARKQP